VLLAVEIFPATLLAWAVLLLSAAAILPAFEIPLTTAEPLPVLEALTAVKPTVFD
jgi:hypothetical protein